MVRQDWRTSCFVIRYKRIPNKLNVTLVSLAAFNQSMNHLRFSFNCITNSVFNWLNATPNNVTSSNSCLYKSAECKIIRLLSQKDLWNQAICMLSDLTIRTTAVCQLFSVDLRILFDLDNVACNWTVVVEWCSPADLYILVDYRDNWWLWLVWHWTL